MSAIITLKSRIDNAKRYIDTNFDPNIDGNYCHFFTGRSKEWDDEYSPDTSTSAFSEVNDALRQMIFMKLITHDDASIGIKRFDWTSGVTYTRADYNIGYTDYKKWITPESPFYVINSEGNIYKCISNNYNSPSTDEPLGQSTTYSSYSDGYIWKFMLSLTVSISTNFLTDTWIPIPFDDAKKDFSHTNTESNAVIGDIPYIHVDNGGEKYTTPPILRIDGDGTGAQATAVMSGESIDYIQMSNNGTGYTHAEVIISGNGVDAIVTAMVSPYNGHGSDASYELGAFYVIMNTDIVGDESGFAPITGTYRNIGIVRNTKNLSSVIITDNQLNTLSSLYITDSSGTYISGELIMGNTSNAQGVVYYDPTGVDKYIDVYMIEGVFIEGETLYGQTSGIFGNITLSSSNITDVNVLSGDILYKENIIFITRKEIQVETFVFTIEF